MQPMAAHFYRIGDRDGLGLLSPPPQFICELMTQPICKHIIHHFKGNPPEIPIHLEFFRNFDFEIF